MSPSPLGTTIAARHISGMDGVEHTLTPSTIEHTEFTSKPRHKDWFILGLGVWVYKHIHLVRVGWDDECLV
jgi:hypothetical protein